MHDRSHVYPTRRPVASVVLLEQDPCRERAFPLWRMRSWGGGGGYGLEDEAKGCRRRLWGNVPPRVVEALQAVGWVGARAKPSLRREMKRANEAAMGRYRLSVGKGETRRLGRLNSWPREGPS